MAGVVGARAPRVYCGAVSAVDGAYVTVRVSDDLDVDGQPVDVIALGAVPVGALVSVQVDATGRAIVVKRS